MRWAERVKLAFSLPLEPSELPRLQQSIKLLATSPKHRSHYKRLAKTPLLWLTAIGGWSITHSVIAYLTLVGTFFLPPNFRVDSFGFFLVNFLFSFGRKYYNDTMIRLPILRRIRSNPESVTDLEADPLRALRYFLKEAVGNRSLASYKKSAEWVLFLKDAVYYSSMSCVLLFFGSFVEVVASVWIPALRVLDGTAVTLAEIGAYGIGIGMVALMIISFVGSWKLQNVKPIFVEESELSVLSPKTERKDEEEGQ